MVGNILHVAKLNKFIPPFVDFLEEGMHVNFSNHTFLFLGDRSKYPYKNRSNIKHYGKGFLNYIFSFMSLYYEIHSSRKVILHGLFDRRVIYCLFFQPWALKKCYWVIWGKDLYTYQDPKKRWKWRRLEFFRRKVIKKMGFLVTYVVGDVRLAREWYGAKGAHVNCIMYTTNLFSEIKASDKSNDKVNVQIGNSADPSNNHLEIFKILEPFKGEDIVIYAPLSYGNKKHADVVVEEGTRIFGDKFIPLLDFMPFDKYIEFLGDIDIAVFNHRRQQAMGNAISLLGMGKKVYLRSDVTSWNVLKGFNVEVYDIEDFTLDLISDDAKNKNKQIIKDEFSRENLADQLKKMFEE